MNTKPSDFTGNNSDSGKLKLIKAALRLAARNRSFSSLGLRELSREAGLTHTAFYRHFKAIDDLAVAIVDEVVTDLRQGLRQSRLSAAGRPGDVITNSTRYYFDFALRNPEYFIVGVREIHGAMPVLRESLRKVIADMAVDMEQDVRAINMFPGLTDTPASEITEVTRMITYQMFYLSLDFIEQPERREEIIAHAVKFIELLTDGALAQKERKAVTAEG